MSQIANLTVDQWGRRYKQPFTGDLYPSVTTILNQAAKPALVNWAAKMVAEYAVEHRNTWADLPAEDAIQLLKGAHRRYTQKRMDIGSAVHTAIEAWMQTDDSDPPMVEADLLPYVSAGIQFLDDHVLKVLRVEATLYNDTLQYAGTTDLFVELKDGRIAVADWKTGKGIWPEVAWQLTAYANAEWEAHQTPGGYVKRPIPQCDLAIAVHLTDNAEYVAHTIQLEPRRMKEFTALRTLQAWADNHKQEVLGPPLTLEHATAS